NSMQRGPPRHGANIYGRHLDTKQTRKRYFTCRMPNLHVRLAIQVRIAKQPRVDIVQVQSRVVSKCVELFGKIIWQPDIVTIQKGDEGSASVSNAVITSRRGSLILLLQILDLIQVRRESLFECRRVRTSIVDYDDLVISKGLVEY